MVNSKVRGAGADSTLKKKKKKKKKAKGHTLSPLDLPLCSPPPSLALWPPLLLAILTYDP